MRPELAAVERSLEQLFRLSLGRRELSQQSEKVGANVSRGGYGILRMLDETSPMSMSEIAVTGSLDPAVVARQVNALEAENLVRRTPSSDDARMRLVEPTTTGVEVYRQIVELRVEYLDAVLNGWDSDDLESIVELVDRLVSDFQSLPYAAEVEK